MKLLKKLDFVFNKLIPKKFIIMLIVCDIASNPNVPPAFYYAVGVYFGGSAIASGVRNFKHEERNYE